MHKTKHLHNKNDSTAEKWKGLADPKIHGNAKNLSQSNLKTEEQSWKTFVLILNLTKKL